jgi:hypothetical protein
VVGFDRSDLKPPTLRSLTVVPRLPSRPEDAAVRINGSLLPVTIPFDGPLERRSLTEIPIVSGPVGLSVLTDDRLDDDKWVLSPYRLRAFVNDRPIAELTYDSINYNHTHLIDLERRVDPSPGIAPRSVNLFRYPHNELWHYREVVNDGWLIPGEALVPGVNLVRIEVSDVAGNTSVGEFGLVLGEPTGDDATDSDTAFVDLVCQPSEGGLVVTVPPPRAGEPNCHRDRECQEPIAGYGGAGGFTFWMPPDRFMGSVWVASNDGTTTRYDIPWQPISREDGGRVTSADGTVSVAIGPDDLFRSTCFKIGVKEGLTPSPSPVSHLYEFSPLDAVFARKARLAISYAETAHGSVALGVYRFRGSRRGWEFAGSTIDSDNHTITATISRPGLFALVADTVPPTIRHVKPGRGQRISNRRPTIRFNLFDDLSGIGSDEDIVLTIEGQWVPVEYDPEQRIGKARPRWDLPPGQHRVEIVARDRMGNEETFLRILHIKKK